VKCKRDLRSFDFAREAGKQIKLLLTTTRPGGLQGIREASSMFMSSKKNKTIPMAMTQTTTDSETTKLT